MSPERPGGGKSPEQEPSFYYRAARFAGELPAGVAYFDAQELIFAHRSDCDLSVFRFQLDDVYHVAVIGQPPAPDLDWELRTALSDGEPTSLPADVLKALRKRRAQASKQAPWVERHYRPGKPL